MKGYLKRFRDYLGSTYFEGRDYSVMAQFIYEFVFVDSPNESRLELFTDFIMNFWTDLMPRTDLVYHKMFESIPDKLRVELANKKDDVLRSRFKEMQEIRRMSGEDFAREAYEFIGTLERMEAVFALFILLSCEKYTPYRHVEVDIIVSPKRAQEDWLQRPWNDFLELMVGFSEGQTIPVCRRLARLINNEPDDERKVMLLYLMFVAIVYLTRKFQLTMYVEEEAGITARFRDANSDFASDCVAAIIQIRNGNRKFRHEFDQAAYFLRNILQFDTENHHLALYIALLKFHNQAMIGRENLPDVKILPFTIN